MTATDLRGANAALFEKLCAAQPMLLGVAPAIEVVPGMTADTILHAGPPVTWAAMTPAMKAAVLGGLVFEGRAADLEAAETLAASGQIRFAPAHDHNAAGAMAGIITASMPMFIGEDRETGLRAYSSINEGLGKALRFGANGPEVLDRLRWIRDEFAPLLDNAIRLAGPMDLKRMAAEALRRGDECHNRNKSATAQFIREIAPALVETGAPHAELVKALRFMDSNDHFFLSISIVQAKVTTLLVESAGIGSLVTVMAGNGVEVGLRVSGLPGQWFTAPAGVADIKLFPGNDISDATPTMGDSYVTEVIGLGAFALAAAPAIASFIGGTVPELLARSARMHQITMGEHPDFRIPALDYQGVPSGIDVFKVVETGINPLINTGIASRTPGKGQIGAGLMTVPSEGFAAAAKALREAGIAPA